MKKPKQDDGVMMLMAIRDDDLCRKFGLCPVRILLRHARLRFLQKMVRNPEHHDAFLTALMGRYLFDTDPPQSNPWLDQFFEDLCHLSDFNGCEEFCEAIAEDSNLRGSFSLRLLLEYSEIRDMFCEFDRKQVKQAYMLDPENM